MEPLDDPLTDEERRAQRHLVTKALGRVIGGPHTLRLPASRMLEAPCLHAGILAALTPRTVDDVPPAVAEGRRLAAALPYRPAPVPFRRDVPRQVEGLL